MKDNFWLENFWKPNAVLILFLIILVAIKVALKCDFEFATTSIFEDKEDITVEKAIAEEATTPSEDIKPVIKTYTEAERQADINAYKNQFVMSIKKHWHPEKESFLIDDNNSLIVTINKDGSIYFPQFEEIGFSDANNSLMKETIIAGQLYKPLPESYNKENLTFKIYFEGNTDSYWGKSYPKDNYAVSLTPINKNREIQNDNKIYKIYLGVYHSAKEAKEAKIYYAEKLMLGTNLIVKCLGTDYYTIQMKSYQNKNNAEKELRYLKEELGIDARIIAE